MEAPWNGEKVNSFVRVLAIVFIICGIFAFGRLLYSLLETGKFTLNELDVRMLIGMLSAPYCFLLFLKVAVTGYAPRSWIPWK